MSTDIELTEVRASSPSGRRYSFSEAIESGRQPPPSYNEAKDKEAAEDTTATTTAAKTTSSFNFKDSVMGVEDLFESKLFRWVVLGVLVVLGIGALLVVILVPLHFGDLDYYQIGFRMQVSTGSVDTSEVFGPGGRYGIGVDYSFKDFPSDSHFSTLDDLSVFSRDRLELFLDVTFQYFIRPGELQPLHDAYDRQYNDIIISRAESVVKAVAPRFSTVQYFNSRSMIEQMMATELFNDLGGQGCCDSYCNGGLNTPEYRIPDLDCTGCLLICPPNLQRFNIDVRYFQLLQVRIPSDVGQQFLNNIILNENAEQEQFAQDAAVETLQIERDVQDIMNQATELSEAASANASLTRSIAQASAAAIVEDARTQGLALLYERLNITEGRHKASLDYIRTLRRTSGNVRLHVGFRDTISGPYNGQNIN